MHLRGGKRNGACERRRAVTQRALARTRRVGRRTHVEQQAARLRQRVGVARQRRRVAGERGERQQRGHERADAAQQQRAAAQAVDAQHRDARHEQLEGAQDDGLLPKRTSVACSVCIALVPHVLVVLLHDPDERGYCHGWGRRDVCVRHILRYLYGAFIEPPRYGGRYTHKLTKETTQVTNKGRKLTHSIARRAIRFPPMVPQVVLATERMLFRPPVISTDAKSYVH